MIEGDLCSPKWHATCEQCKEWIWSELFVFVLKIVILFMNNEFLTKQKNEI